MAAEIKAFPGATGPQKLQLVSKLEGHQDVVNSAVILRGEEGVISISDDKSVNSYNKYLYSLFMSVFCFLIERYAYGSNEKSEVTGPVCVT